MLVGHVCNLAVPFSGNRFGHAAVLEPVGRKRLWLIGGVAEGPAATQKLSLHPAPLRALALECAAAVRVDGQLPKSLEEEMEEYRLASGLVRDRREPGGRGAPSGPIRSGKKKREEEGEEGEGRFPKVRRGDWGLGPVRSESSTRGC